LIDYTEAAWEEGKLEAADELFAEGVIVHNVPAETDFEGIEEFKEWISNTRNAFPDFAVESSDEDFIGGENKVAVQWVATGTNERPLARLDIEPTNEHVEFEGVTVFEFDNGKVTEAWWYYDMLGFLDQLGVVPQEMAP
jgi:steroid delta-isomerase-like uncharacterized protein